MELEQARKRAAELRAVIEKNNRLYLTRTPRNWKITSMTS